MAMPDFAEDAQPRTGLQLLLLARVEVEKAQRDHAAIVTHFGDQLPARAELDITVENSHFALHVDAGRCLGQRRDDGFILEAQRQMQGKIFPAATTYLRQFAGERWSHPGPGRCSRPGSLILQSAKCRARRRCPRWWSWPHRRAARRKLLVGDRRASMPCFPWLPLQSCVSRVRHR